MFHRPERESSWTDEVSFDRVTIITAEDTVRGILVDTFADGVQLADASLLRANDPDVPFAGDLFIPKSRIKFIQRPERTRT